MNPTPKDHSEAEKRFERWWNEHSYLSQEDARSIFEEVDNYYVPNLKRLSEENAHQKQVIEAAQSKREELIKWLYLFVQPWDGQSLMDALKHEHGDKYKRAYDHGQSESPPNPVEPV